METHFRAVIFLMELLFAATVVQAQTAQDVRVYVETGARTMARMEFGRPGPQFLADEWELTKDLVAYYGWQIVPGKPTEIKVSAEKGLITVGQPVPGHYRVISVGVVPGSISYADPNDPITYSCLDAGEGGFTCTGSDGSSYSADESSSTYVPPGFIHLPRISIQDTAPIAPGEEAALAAESAAADKAEEAKKAADETEKAYKAAKVEETETEEKVKAAERAVAAEKAAGAPVAEVLAAEEKVAALEKPATAAALAALRASEKAEKAEEAADAAVAAESAAEDKSDKVVSEEITEISKSSPSFKVDSGDAGASPRRPWQWAQYNCEAFYMDKANHMSDAVFHTHEGKAQVKVWKRQMHGCKKLVRSWWEGIVAAHPFGGSVISR